MFRGSLEEDWTGNRVTCRDWFQLTLKEGLTVYRDQRFTADMYAQAKDGAEHGAEHGAEEDKGAAAAALKRIEDVKTVRSAQWSEDGERLSPFFFPFCLS